MAVYSPLVHNTFAATSENLVDDLGVKSVFVVPITEGETHGDVGQSGVTDIIVAGGLYPSS